MLKSHCTKCEDVMSLNVISDKPCLTCSLKFAIINFVLKLDDEETLNFIDDFIGILRK